MITDPFFYLCAIPAVLLFGMSKGGLGGGPAMLSVPLMALAISPLKAAAILLPILVVMDAFAVWRFRHHWSRANIRITLPGAIAGIVIGAFTFRYLPEDAVKILIGLIALVFSLDYWLRRTIPPATGVNPVKGSFWGLLAGFTSFGIHAGGPPISVYLLPQQMEKRELMGTFAVFFAVVNMVKLVPYAWLGELSTDNLATSLVLIPLAPVGVFLGYAILTRVSQTLIYRISYFFLVVVGIRLLWGGVAGLF
ncbi:MAG: membrane protein [Gammaproteobacteria bacterium BRH_c0]|nr:MAG: membrane protein [Gammaproteobacteria bacterium BRH_c0]